jgi:hypothetical protein
MKTSKNKIMQALSGLLPDDVSKDVVEAVDAFVSEMKADLDKEYDAKLAEAYKIVATEKQDSEKVAEQGYAEAYQIISELRDRLEVQREEFDIALEEGYEEAYKMLVEEKTKNETLEVDLYDEYDKKLAEIKEYMVDKLDSFLATKGEEFYEQAKQDVLNDPMVAEHKIALEKILEVASNYMTEEDHLVATGAKVETLTKRIKEIEGQQRIVEAKNMRLATENSKLNEAVRQQAELMTENVKNDEKARLKKSRTVEGRGQKSTENPIVIGEHVNAGTAVDHDEQGTNNTRFVENTGNSITEQWRHLAGVVAPVHNKK